ncbi:FG-GAP-like repeat-containing protein [Polaribacter sp.]|nr:FG-GAP-like repeat-containing protein [Polaribacter sp.]
MKNIFKFTSNLFLFICVISTQMVASQTLTLSSSETNIPEDGSITLTASLNEANDSEDTFLPLSLSGTATDGLDYNISFDSQGEESVIYDFDTSILDFDYLDDGRLVILRNSRDLDIYQLDGTISSINLNESNGVSFDSNTLTIDGTDIYLLNGNFITKLDTDTLELSSILGVSGNFYFGEKIDFYDGKLYYIKINSNNNSRYVYSLVPGETETLLGQSSSAIRNVAVSDSGAIYLWEQNHSIRILNASGDLEEFSYYDNGYYQDVKFVNNNLYALVYDYDLNMNKVIRFNGNPYQGAMGPNNYEDLPYQSGSQVISVDSFRFSSQGDLLLSNHISGSLSQLSSYSISPQLKITAGETSGTLTINGEDDSLFELDETIIVTPGTVTNATLSDDSAITMTLTDNDTAPEVTFAFSSESIDENSSNTVTLTATSSEVSGSDITIPFTLSGTAAQTTEYTVSSSEILISTGSTTSSVTISTEGLDDDEVEVLETIVFTFGTLVNATTETTDLTLNLLSEDNPLITSITPSESSITEGGSLTLTATIDAATSVDAILPLSLSGTATNILDYNISFDSQGEESLVLNNSNYINTIRLDSTGRLLYIRNSELVIFDVAASSSTTYTLSDNYQYFDLFSDNIIYAKKDGQGTGIGKIDITDLSNIIETQQVTIQNNHWIEGNFNLFDNTIVYNVYNSSGSGNQRQTYKQVGDNTPEKIYDGNDCCFGIVQLNNKIYQIANSYLYELVDGELTNYQQFDGFNINYEKLSVHNNEIYVKGNYGNNQNQTAVGKLTISNSEISFTPLPAIITNFNIESLDIDPSTGNLFTSSYNNSDSNYTINMYQLSPEIIVTAGETSGTLTINGEDDSLFELDETIIVTPGTVTNATLSDDSAITMTLTDNDTAPEVTFAFSSESIDENSSNTVTLTATSSEVSGSDITIPFTLSGTASQTTEYTVSSSEILISTGSTTSSVTISTEGLDDDEVEVLETIIFTFGTLVNATTETTDLTLNLLSEDVTNANIVANNPNMNEGESTSITLNLDTPTSKSVIVPLIFTGTAEFNIDYTVDFDTEGDERFLIGLQENSSDFSTLEDGRPLLFNNNRLLIANVSDNTIETYYLDEYFQYFNLSDGIIYLKSNDKIHQVLVENLVPSDDPMTPNNISTTPILTNSELGNNEYYAGGNISSEGNEFIYQIGGANDGNYKVYRKQGDNNSELIYQGQTYAEKLLLFNNRVYAFNSDTVTELYNQEYTNSISYNNVFFYNFKTYNNQLYSLVSNNGDREIVKLSIETDIINSSSNGTLSLVSYQLSDTHQYISNFSFDNLGNLLLLNRDNNSQYRIDFYQLFPQIYIPAGGDTGTFTFNSVDDISFENDETIVISPGDLQNTTVSSEDLTLTIIDDDNPPVITFELSSETIVEDSEISVSLTATSDIPSGREITIPFSLSGTAMEDEYEIIDGVTQIVIPGNSTSSSITISTFNYNDDDVEESETIIFDFDLENIINATSEIENITLNLLDDDLTTIASLESDLSEVTEGDPVTLTATITTATSSDVYLPVVFGGTASSSVDYETIFESRGEEKLIRELSNSYSDISILSNGKMVLYRNNPSELVIYDSVENTFDTASLNNYIDAISVDGNVIYVRNGETINSVDITDISSGSVELTTVLNAPTNTYFNYFSVTAGNILYRVYDTNIGDEQIYLRRDGASTSEILYTGGGGYMPIAFNNKFYLIYDNTVFELKDGELLNAQTYSITGVSGDIRVYRDGQSNKMPKVINDKLYVRRTDNGQNSLMILNPTSGLLTQENYNLGDDINYIQGNSIGSDGDLIFLNNYGSDGQSWGLFSYLQSSQIKINAGDLSGSLTINTIDDSSYEFTETISVSPGNTETALIDDSISSFDISILDNDSQPSVSFELSADAIVENSNNTVQLTATLDNISGYDTTITFSDMSGTASQDEYTLVGSLPLIISAGSESASITISTEGKDDDEVEILETIIFTISDIENGTTESTEIVLLLESEDNPNLISVVGSPLEFGEHETSTITATIDAASSQDVLIPLNISGTATDGLDYNFSFDSQGEESIIKEFSEGVNDFDYLDDGRLVTIRDYRNLDIYELDGTITSLNLNEGGQDYEGTDIITNGSDIYIRNWYHIVKLDTETMELSYVIQNSNSSNLYFSEKIDFYDGKIYYVIQDQNNEERRVYSITPGGSEELLGEFNNGVAIRNVAVSDSGAIYLWEQNHPIRILNASGDLEEFSYYDNGYYQDVKFVNNNLYALVYDYGLSNNKIIRFNGNPYQGAMGPNNYEDLPYQLGSQVMSVNHFNFSNQGELVLFNQLSGSSYQLSSYNTIPEITITAGETSGSLVVNGLEDDLNAPGEEEDETIILGLLDPTNAVIPSDITIEDITLTILNNEISLIEDTDALANVPALSSSSVAWGDYDRDGDQDLAIMGLSSTLGVVTRLYENNNGVFINSNPGIFDKRYEGDLIWVDYNKDGYLDIIISGLNVNDVPTTTIYENIDGQTFVESTDLNLPNLFSTSLDSGDLDNDGDIDFIINGFKIVDGSNVWKKYIYVREGDSFILESDYNNQFNDEGIQNGVVKIADNNFDGDLDIIMLGGSEGSSSRIKSNTFIKNENQNNDDYLPPLDNPSVALFGEFVYFMGETDNSNNDIKLYRKSLITGQLEEFNEIPGLIKGSIAIADYNNDGFEDMVITGENSDAESVTKIYDGNNSYFGFSENTDITLTGLRNSTAKWVDYDLDGDLDLFLSGTSDDGEFSKLYRTDLLNKTNSPSQAITSLSVEDLGNGKVKLIWDVPEDDFSSSLGYILRLGTSEGGSELSNTESNLETGQRLITKSPVIYTNSFETILNPGIYSWSVQSVDDGLKGSVFSEENTFVLTYEWKLLNQGGIIDRSINALGKPVVKLTDIDLDNDMDLVYGSSENTNDIQLFTLGAKNFEYASSLSNSRNLSDLKFLDFNNDGTQDILINSWEGNGNDYLKLYNSSSEGTYNEVFSAPGLFDAKIELIDINNDGVKEIVHIGRTSSAFNSQLKVYVYEQEGNILNDSPIDISSQFGALKSAAYAFGNIDNDDDIDFGITGFSNSGQQSSIYLNETVYTETIAPIYTEISTEFPTAVESTLDFFDYDGDGDLDMALTGQGIDGVMFKILENNGLTGDDLSFTEVQNTGLIPIREAKLDFGDYNSDGYADILYSGKVSGQGQVTKLVEFDSETQTYVESDFDLSDIINASIAFGDVDGDNDLDFSIAGESNSNNENIIKTYLNVRNESAEVLDATNRFGRDPVEYVINEKPTQPSGLTTEVLGYDNVLDTYKVKFTWEASTDDYTSQNGLTYALKVGTSEGADDIMKINSLTNGYRLSAGKGNVEHRKEWVLNLPDDDYFWSVQAIDAAFSGSELSETKTVTPSTSLSTNQYQLLDVMVYPNPVNDGFVNIETSLNETKHVKMYDLQGRSIISKKLTGNKLNISNVSAGVYLLKVTIDRKQKVVKLIIN